MIEVIRLSSHNPQLDIIWDSFISDRRLPGLASSAWKNIIEDYYAQRILRVLAFDENKQPVGYFFGYHRSGRKSVLYNLNFGFHADTENVAEALFANIHDYCVANEISSTLISLGAYSGPAPGRVWEKTNMFMPLVLTPDQEDLFNCLPKKTRNIIRKAENESYEISSDWSRFEGYYKVYEDRFLRKKLKTKSREYFYRLKRAFPNDLQIITASRAGCVVAGMVFLRAGSVVSYMGNASTDADARYGVNNLLMWEAMQHFRNQGVDLIELGESSEDGPVYEFKRKLHSGVKIVRVGYADLLHVHGEYQKVWHPFSDRLIFLLMRFYKVYPNVLRRSLLKIMDKKGRVV